MLIGIEAGRARSKVGMHSAGLQLGALLEEARVRLEHHNDYAAFYLHNSRGLGPIPGAYGTHVQHDRLAREAAKDVAALERVIVLVQKSERAHPSDAHVREAMSLRIGPGARE